MGTPGKKVHRSSKFLLEKPGLHGVFVDNVDKYVEMFQEEGIDLVQSGMFPPKLKYAYMDFVDVFGAVIEIMELVKRKKKK